MKDGQTDGQRHRGIHNIPIAFLKQHGDKNGYSMLFCFFLQCSERL